jgi:hypothetical protein
VKPVRRLALAALSLALLASVPAAAAKTVRWGSSLKAPATRTIPGTYHADAEFWPTALGSSTASGVTRTVKAPVSGRILSVKLKVGDDSAAVPIRFSVVKRQSDGRFQVLTTSTPSLPLAAHSPGVHTFDMSRLQFKMPINKGDYLAVSTPGADPSAMVWYGAVGGAGVDSFTSRGATQNPGYRWSGTRHAGVELLMQVAERPGPAYHFHLPG